MKTMAEWTLLAALIFPALAKADDPSAGKLLEKFKANHCTAIVMSYRVAQRLGPHQYEIIWPNARYPYEQRAILTTHSIDYDQPGVMVESAGVAKKSRLETAMYAIRKGRKKAPMKNGFSSEVEILEESKTCKDLGLKIGDAKQMPPQFGTEP